MATCRFKNFSIPGTIQDGAACCCIKYSLFLLPYNLPACCIRYPPFLVWYTVRFCRCCTVSSIFHSCYNAKWTLLYQTVLHSCSNARWKKLSVPERHCANFLPCEVLFLSFQARKCPLTLNLTAVADLPTPFSKAYNSKSP